jgi:hypothetical protein
VAAVVVHLTLGSPESKPPEFGETVQQIIAEDRLNANNAENVYQQQVVNGWTARDLLRVIADQGTLLTEGYHDDDRIAALLVLLVLAVALHTVTTPRPARDEITR